MFQKVLITDYVHPYLIQQLEKRGFQVDYEKDISYDEVKKKIAGYTGVVINSKVKMTKEVMLTAKNLKFIARLGSGLEIIDLAFAECNHIHVINSPEGNRNAVAEHAVGMLLALANNILRGDRQVRNKIWERELNRGFELKGKTVGIIGVGHTGGTFAEKLKNWDVKILGYDKYKTNLEDYYPFLKQVELKELQEKSDIISFHLPLTKETRNVCNRAFIRKCREGVVIINTSRGGVVNLEHLIETMQTKKVMGACLDVFANEKPKTFDEKEKRIYEILYSFENVVLSPHVAGWTKESLKRISEVLIRKLDDIL